MWPNLQFPADLVTFTKEILNAKLNFLCSAGSFRVKLEEWNVDAFMRIYFYMIRNKK